MTSPPSWLKHVSISKNVVTLAEYNSDNDRVNYSDMVNQLLINYPATESSIFKISDSIVTLMEKRNNLSFTMIISENTSENIISKARVLLLKISEAFISEFGPVPTIVMPYSMNHFGNTIKKLLESDSLSDEYDTMKNSSALKLTEVVVDSPVNTTHLHKETIFQKKRTLTLRLCTWSILTFLILLYVYINLLWN